MCFFKISREAPLTAPQRYSEIWWYGSNGHECFVRGDAAGGVGKRGAQNLGMMIALDFGVVFS